MNTELIGALKQLEQEKRIRKEVILTAVENALIAAAKNNYKKAEEVTATVDPKTGDYHVYIVKTVVSEVSNTWTEISLEEAHTIDGSYQIGDKVPIELDSHEFGRIATGAARNTIIQTIRTQERENVLREFSDKEHTVVTGVVQRRNAANGTIMINLGSADGILADREQVKGENYRPQQRIRVYILEAKAAQKGTRIRVSRTHPDLVRGLFEQEVSEIADGTVEIKAIAREPGNRTKIAVWSNDEDVDPVGACVGMNGTRVNAVVEELNGEKIDIINWSETPAFLIENALSPAKVISVIADSEEKTAKVVVPDFQLSLAIGREGQNARLAARLTGYKIDIKSETQAIESGEWPPYEGGDEGDYDDGEEYYDENGEYVGEETEVKDGEES
ncbi:MAG: transcription termination/antitermination protein NusA [Lachnospiraceae bacterium]|nr:transcription termination/antitermination protein NusA [Lachnospiraceae bacterium]MBQ6258792.1 transcription termination/antitermination protein NusA [Lachnospiraceae bacterium]